MPTFSTPSSHVRGNNMSSTSLGNLSQSSRSQSSNLRLGMHPNDKPLNLMSSGRSRAWSSAFTTSKYLDSLVDPFHGERYGHNNGSWNASTPSLTCASIWSSNSWRAFSSLLDSVETTLPLSAAYFLVNRGGARTVPVFCLVFFFHGVRGDFRTPCARLPPFGSSRFSCISSMNRARVLAMALMVCLRANFLLLCSDV